jgi:hypothetical protein
VTQLTIRGMVGEAEYSEVESYVQYGLVPHFTRLDQVLTAAYDAKLRSPHTPATMSSSGISADMSAILDCAYIITNYLWTIVNFSECRQRCSTIARGRETGVGNTLPQRLKSLSSQFLQTNAVTFNEGHYSRVVRTDCHPLVS